MEIIKENDSIWGIKKDLAYGVWHYTKIYLGEDKKETPKQKKQKKEADE